MARYGFPTDNPEQGPPISGIIGSSPAMEEVYRLTRRVARSTASVLILGETGTGKELIASAVHRLSDRQSGPFVKVNCGALSESLLESELFGHVRGAFTGAVNNRAGRFEAAHTGTIFLDEINSTSLLLQVKLLRVLQEREFERVGDTQTVNVDTRVIAASNRELAKEVEEGKFREDLYWRLNVVPIFIPPLRQRREDIPLLVSHFLRYYSEANNRNILRVQTQAMEAMQDYHWPGNVRELQNYVERSVIMANGDELTVDLLPEAVIGKTVGGKGLQSPLESLDFETLVRELVSRGVQNEDGSSNQLHSRVVDCVEKELIAQVLTLCNNIQTKTAARLGINRNTLHKKLKDYGLEDGDSGED